MNPKTQKMYLVQAPVHQVFGFFVPAESAEEALATFRASDPLTLAYTPTHDWRDASENVMDPIRSEAFPPTFEEEGVELDTSYLRHLRRRFDPKAPRSGGLRVRSTYDAMVLIQALDLFLETARHPWDRIARRYMRQLHRILARKVAP